MQRQKHRPRLARQDRPVRTPGQGWHIGTAPERSPAEPGPRIDLTFPITINGETRSLLTMRCPTPKDWAWFRLQRGGDHENVLRMVARLCSITRDDLRQLDEVDLIGLLDACDAMMGEG